MEDQTRQRLVDEWEQLITELSNKEHTKEEHEALLVKIDAIGDRVACYDRESGFQGI